MAPYFFFNMRSFVLAAGSVAGLLGLQVSASSDLAATTNPLGNAQRNNDLRYSVEIRGVPETELRDLLNRTSQLVALKSEPPLTLNSLARRVSQDRERLLEALRSEGFYGAMIDAKLDHDRTPIDIALHIDTGPIYLLEAYEVTYTDSVPPGSGAPTDIEDLNLHVGMFARAPRISQARQDLLRRLANLGYPFATLADNQVVVDHDRTTMRVAVSVAPGPAATFGALDISGLKTVSEDYIRRMIPWELGEVYDKRKLEAFRSRLISTELFSGIRLDHAPAPEPDGRLPISARLMEADHRSIGAGADFSTDIGFGGNVFWEHRNIFGRNERLNLSVRGSGIEQRLGANFAKPNFRRLGQSFLLEGSVQRERHDAFDDKGVTTFSGLERELSETWRARSGVSTEYSVITDSAGQRRSTLVGLPTSLRYDSTDDLLHPTKGARLHLAAAPYVGTVDRFVTFASLEAGGSGYLAVDRDDTFILAGRARVGHIVGENRDTIPANKRFYAGGGGSIRGYPFRSVGPLDSDRDPLGGRSVLELGLETRMRLSESFGLVPFVDGGSTARNSVPETFGDIHWSAGIGARYFTAIGPLRLDIAFPLNRREGVDSAFMIYFSVGQAF